jgi:hypothetical protein
METVRQHIRQFKADQGVDRVIVLWTANTERYSEVIEGLNDTADNLMKSIDANESGEGGRWEAVGRCLGVADPRRLLQVLGMSKKQHGHDIWTDGLPWDLLQLPVSCRHAADCSLL